MRWSRCGDVGLNNTAEVNGERKNSCRVRVVSFHLSSFCLPVNYIQLGDPPRPWTSGSHRTCSYTTCTGTHAPARCMHACACAHTHTIPGLQSSRRRFQNRTKMSLQILFDRSWKLVRFCGCLCQRGSTWPSLATDFMSAARLLLEHNRNWTSSMTENVDKFLW